MQAENTDNSPSRPSLLRRLASMFYEAWLILALWFLVDAALTGLYILTSNTDHQEGELALTGFWLHALFILMIATVLSFYSYFWLKSGQTLAMQAWKMRLIGSNDETITLKQCFIRIVSSWLSLAALGLGYLWCLWDKEGKTWHDKLSNTELILEPKK